MDPRGKRRAESSVTFHEHPPGSSVRTVSVVGGGVAGLATALALRQQGVAVRVAEQAATASRKGMVVLLMGNGLAALDRLGLGESVRAAGGRVTEVVVRDPRGRETLRRSLDPHLGLARATLVGLLTRALPGGVLCFAREFRRFVTPARARYGDGSTDAAELFVGADGGRSRVREWVCRGRRPSRGRIVDLLSTVDAPDVTAAVGSTLLRYRHPDGGLGASIVPLGSGRVGWHVTFDTIRWPIEDATAWRRNMAGEVAHWDPLLAALHERTDFAGSFVWRGADMDPLPRLRRGNVVLVGDAAHPFIPLSTQGANSALVDAVSLGDALGRGRDIDSTLTVWQASRLPAARAYLEYGRARARVFLDPRQGPDPPFPAEAERHDLRILAEGAPR